VTEFFGELWDVYAAVFSSFFSTLPMVALMLAIVSMFQNSGFVLGFGCTTLGVTACGGGKCGKQGCPEPANNMTRADYDKAIVRFMTFIPCGAKLPVFVYIVFKMLGFGLFGIVFLYLFAVMVGVVLGGYKVLTVPKLRNIGVWDFLKQTFFDIAHFVYRVSTALVFVIFVIHLLEYFGLLLRGARFLEPIFVPIGLGSAAVIVSLAMGLIGKEMILAAIMGFGVSALGLTTAGMISFAVFVALYTPCVPALLAIRRRFGTKFMLSTAWINFAVAWGMAFVVYNIAVLWFML